MQLCKIILWPERTELEKRVVEFQPGKVNYIVGDSDTGKSSVWPIIDYCLCSSELRIPVGPARDMVSWYAIVLFTGDGELLIARQNNSILNQQTQKPRQSAFMMLKADKIVIPDIPQKNTDEATVEKLISSEFRLFLELKSKELYDELLYNLQDHKIGKISFRDLLTLNHQLQYALINPSSFVSESHYISILKLKRVLPLLLYSKETAFYRIKKGIQNRVINEQKNLRGQLVYLINRMQALYKEACQVGLVELYIDPDIPISSDELRQALESVLYMNDDLIKDSKGRRLSNEKLLVIGKIIECLEHTSIIDKYNISDFELQIVKSDVSSIEYDYKQDRSIGKELSDFSNLIRAYARKLRLNYQEFIPIFDERDAILKFRTPHQDIFLYQLGNNKSYVGYNIATFLSLHEFFGKNNRNPILSFLLLDHPGQAFSLGQNDDKDESMSIIFDCLDFCCANRMKNLFQIIVLERVKPNIDTPYSVVVEEWTNKTKLALIPESWK